MDALQAVAQHRPILLIEDLFSDLDDVVRTNPHQVIIEGRMVQSAECESVRHCGFPLRVTIGKDVCGIE